MSDHGIEKALNIDLLDPDFIAALEKAWCVETCWNGCKKDYPADGSNSAFGNCFVSTLAAWADRGFQDEIVPCTFREPGATSDGWHFQLQSRGVTIDPTFQQFIDGVVVKQLPPGDPMHNIVAFGSIFDPAEEASLRERLALLIQRMDTEGGYELSYTADDIVDLLKQRFAYVVPAPAPNARPT